MYDADAIIEDERKREKARRIIDQMTTSQHVISRELEELELYHTFLKNYQETFDSSDGIEEIVSTAYEQLLANTERMLLYYTQMYTRFQKTLQEVENEFEYYDQKIRTAQLVVPVT